MTAELDDLLAAIRAGKSHWLIISNEVGLGVVPDNRLARIYRDGLERGVRAAPLNTQNMSNDAGV